MTSSPTASASRTRSVCAWPSSAGRDTGCEEPDPSARPGLNIPIWPPDSTARNLNGFVIFLFFCGFKPIPQNRPELARKTHSNGNGMATVVRL